MQVEENVANSDHFFAKILDLRDIRLSVISGNHDKNFTFNRRQGIERKHEIVEDPRGVAGRVQ